MAEDRGLSAPEAFDGGGFNFAAVDFGSFDASSFDSFDAGPASPMAAGIAAGGDGGGSGC